MADTSVQDAMFDTYIFETTKQIERLEQLVLAQDEGSVYDGQMIDEIFRIMHTIKGSSGMMDYAHIAHLAHTVEDVFSLLRKEENCVVDYSILSDYILKCVDYIKEELNRLCENLQQPEEASKLSKEIKDYIFQLKQGVHTYEVCLFFEKNCDMPDLRAYEVVNKLKQFIKNFSFEPNVLEYDETHAQLIREKGFKIIVHTEKKKDEVDEFFSELLFVDHVNCKLVEKEKQREGTHEEGVKLEPKKENVAEKAKINGQAFTNISFEKLDHIMDLLGEMVVAEAMVLENPEIINLNIDSFQKAARNLSKITEELQDEIISMRLVAVSTVFQKMNRIVRDMNKQLGKKVALKLVGEETEIDKKVVDFITDPIMHMVRNAIDHGIEYPEERIKAGKKAEGNIVLDAINDGGDVFIKIKDDGRGLNKEGILKKAIENKLISPDDMLTDEQIYQLIFQPGFSTKQDVSAYSGRGVGMDVVIKNLEAIGGLIQIETEEGVGTVFSIKIPLTMAIIDGMTLRVGDCLYTVPTRLIKESFRPNSKQIVTKTDDSEILILRGECLPILRLYKRYHIPTKITDLEQGIVVRLEQNNKSVCIFVDEIVGQQQVVIKALPTYLKEIRKIQGISGCTLLGDGQISLILDFEGLLSRG